MSKKDYILIAGALHAAKPVQDCPDITDATMTWLRVRSELMMRLEEGNPRFNSDRFKDATEGRNGRR